MQLSLHVRCSVISCGKLHTCPLYREPTRITNIILVEKVVKVSKSLETIVRQEKMSALTPRPGDPSTSLQRLHHVEKKIVHTVELAGRVMEELAKTGGPRQEVVNVQCQEFMQAVKEIQTTLRDEIKSMCEYRPYENSDYPARINSEISVKKLECVIGQIEAMREAVAQYEAVKPM
uniref:Mediator of RNA polymerase II transcription subunit 11 n=1 Tax=Physcomitrium patens TaxID=3218 RepID=A0A2K1JZH8_PHYPA|nr:hypothetical protein PHYPA_014052 [Physcomitrium patens]